MTDIDETLIALFHEQFQTPTEAGFSHDRESDDGYAWLTDAVETEDALAELFESVLTEAKLTELTDVLNGEAPQWVRIADLDNLRD